MASQQLLATRLRGCILSTWPMWKAAKVQQHIARAQPSEGTKTVAELRIARKLLGLPTARGYRYPEFQFDPATGLVRPEMAALIALLPHRFSPWSLAFWFAQPTRLLLAPKRPRIDLTSPDAARLLREPVEGVMPADCFRRDPQAVLDYARSVF